ncbi:MAG: hypothetical protein L0H83_11180, partial [Salinisphaera sp.]|nr:hypothetical protein [Salinisphaera sp.]
FSALDAAIAYLLTQQDQYRDLAIATLLASVAEAKATAQAGGAPHSAHDSYYSASSEIVPVAFVVGWYSDQLSDSELADCAWYCHQTVWNIWHHEQAQWFGHAHEWSGWATNNPANNYFYNFTLTTMAWALASGAAMWMDKVRHSLLPMLKTYFETVPHGGSYEGTAYGLSHSRVFELLILWKDSTGEDWTTPHVAGSIDYWLAATTPDFLHSAVIGDQARVSDAPIWDYHRLLILRARYLVSDATKRKRATWWLNRVAQLVDDGFNARGNLLPPGDTETVPPLIYYANEVGHLFARTGHGADSLWLCFTAGIFTEGHEAQDEGGFTLYKAGWLAVTSNIWSHSGIHQDTPGRNLLRFERAGEVIPQLFYPDESPQARMTVTSMNPSTGEVAATANLLPAYKGQAGVEAWQRAVEFSSAGLYVLDTYATDAETQAVWQLTVPEQPTVNGNVVTAGGLTITVLEPANAVIELFDWTSLGSEYSQGWRIDVKGGVDVYQVLIDVTGNGVPS